MLDGRSAVANALMQQGGGYPGGYAGDPLRSPIGPRVPMPAAGRHTAAVYWHGCLAKF